MDFHRLHPATRLELTLWEQGREALTRPALYALAGVGACLLLLWLDSRF